MRPSLLTQSDLSHLAEICGGWQLSADQKSLQVCYKFADFKTVFAFMNEMAEAAEALDHHPKLTNSYNRLSISLTTHDVGGLTELDVALAQKMTHAAHNYGAKLVSDR